MERETVNVSDVPSGYFLYWFTWVVLDNGCIIIIIIERVLLKCR